MRQMRVEGGDGMMARVAEDGRRGGGDGGAGVLGVAPDYLTEGSGGASPIRCTECGREIEGPAWSETTCDCPLCSECWWAERHLRNCGGRGAWKEEGGRMKDEAARPCGVLLTALPRQRGREASAEGASLCRGKRRRELTQRQRQVLAFVQLRLRETGLSPTVREIITEMGVRSPCTVQRHLDALVRKGALARVPHGMRGLRVVGAEACFRCGATPERMVMDEDGRAWCPSCAGNALARVA